MHEALLLGRRKGHDHATPTNDFVGHVDVETPQVTSVGVQAFHGVEERTKGKPVPIKIELKVRATEEVRPTLGESAEDDHGVDVAYARSS